LGAGGAADAQPETRNAKPRRAVNSFNTIAVLIVAYLLVWLQATFNELRPFIGAQVDLLPSLIVYTGLSCGVVSLTLISVCAGLWFDSLSANPLGVSLLPLFLIGLFIQRYREFILRDQAYAQMIIGFIASAAAPFMIVLLLLNLDEHPLIGWFSIWQWMVVSVAGALMTPVWFRLFHWIGHTLNYRAWGETSFRTDREIKRGRQ
jgi:cell shape-determining protein MreD